MTSLTITYKISYDYSSRRKLSPIIGGLYHSTNLADIKRHFFEVNDGKDVYEIVLSKTISTDIDSFMKEQQLFFNNMTNIFQDMFVEFIVEDTLENICFKYIICNGAVSCFVGNTSINYKKKSWRRSFAKFVNVF